MSKSYTPEVYDHLGQRWDWDWLTSQFGKLTYHNAGAGMKFRLARVDVSENIAAIRVRVLAANRDPIVGVDVANSWPDPGLPSLSDKGSRSLWKISGASQFTGNWGETGFGIGQGSFVNDAAQGGPHTVWVLSGQFPSDGISGIGISRSFLAGPLSLTFVLDDTLSAMQHAPAQACEEIEAIRDVALRLTSNVRGLATHVGCAVQPIEESKAEGICADTLSLVTQAGKDILALCEHLNAPSW